MPDAGDRIERHVLDGHGPSIAAHRSLGAAPPDGWIPDRRPPGDDGP